MTNHLPESSYLNGERQAELETIRENDAREELQRCVEALKAEFPRISMGYLGNYERWGDDTHHYIFLPHSNRVGKYGDMVGLGAGTNKTKFREAIANWETLVGHIRRFYNADPNRIEHLTLRDGRLFKFDGTASQYAPNTQFMAPVFKTIAEAEVWLERYNYPSTTLPKLPRQGCNHIIDTYSSTICMDCGGLLAKDEQKAARVRTN